jgi:hypothetical protein
MPETRTVEASFDDWLCLIRAEYFELPGLHLTKKQAEQLWGLDASTCEPLLAALVDARFLRRTKAGAYMRTGGGG